LIYDLLPHYKAQANASFWIRPRNAVLSREVNNHNIQKLNEKHRLNAKSKAEAVRRILYDGGFSYDGVLPTGALQGDPQFTSVYDSDDAITRYSVMREHLARDVKAHGFDCTGHRQKSLYLQALAGNKTARKTLNAAYHGNFPSHPRDAWAAIETIQHEIYRAYIKQNNYPNRLCTHPMYPAISPPLPNPVKLRGFIIRAKRSRDILTLSWMLGRDLEQQEISAGSLDRLILAVLHRFGYTAMEIDAMRRIVDEQESRRQSGAANGPEDKSTFLWGCLAMLVPATLFISVLRLVGYLISSRSTVGNLIGLALLMGLVLAILIVLCKVYRGKKSRPP